MSRLPSKPAMPFDLWRSIWTWHVGLWNYEVTGSEPRISEFKDTEWYNQNRPNSVAAAKEWFKTNIRNQAATLCRDKKLSPINDFVVGPMNLSIAGHNSWSEAALGDPQQSFNEARFWIGWYQFRLADIQFEDLIGQGGINYVKYTAEILLVDKLGAEEQYAGDTWYSQLYYIAIAGPSREYVSGRWPITGIIRCCATR